MRKTILTAAVSAFLLSSIVGLPALAHAGEQHEPAPQEAQADGVVKAVDAAAGSVTIQHGPIAALRWPAMTMKFRVATSATLAGISSGQSVHFVLKNVDGKPVVTQIQSR